MLNKKVSEYEQKAIDFAAKYGVEMSAEYRGHYKRGDFFITAVWAIALSRKDKKPYTFEFSASVYDSYCHFTGIGANKKDGIPGNLKLEEVLEEIQKRGYCCHKQFQIRKQQKAPTLYDVLACVQKYDVGSFENFCGDFGYDTDSRKAEKIYFDCQKEFDSVRALFGDCMEELQEIS